MNCPKCGTPYEPDTKFCSTCGHPLDDADYRFISKKDYRKKKLSSIAARLIAAAAILVIVAMIGYHAYIQFIKKHCRQAVDEVFQAAHEMDFSSIDPEYLPDKMKENPNIRTLLKEELSKVIGKDTTANPLAAYLSEVIDIDMICDDIISTASYKILSVEADYHTCKVTVRTENTDYSKVFDNLYSDIQERITDNESIWESIGSFFSSIFGGDDDSSDKKPDLTGQIREFYQDAKDKTDKLSITSTIEFGFEDGSWDLTAVDPELFYTYYGISGFISR